MASRSSSISVFSDGSIQVTKDQPQEGQGGGAALWQHGDDLFVFGAVRDCAPCPAVWPMDDHKVSMTKQWQFFIRAINYGMSIQHVSALFGPLKAFTNRPKSDLRADYLKGENLDCEPPDLDRVRTCSLSVMTGTVSGASLIVSMLDGWNPPPLKPGYVYPERVEDIDREAYLYTPWTHRHFFFAAAITNAAGDTVPFANGAVYDWFEGGQRPVSWMPHVSKRPVAYPLARLIRVSGLPSPYRP